MTKGQAHSHAAVVTIPWKVCRFHATCSDDSEVYELCKLISSVLPYHSSTGCLVTVIPFQTYSSALVVATLTWLGPASKAGRA